MKKKAVYLDSARVERVYKFPYLKEISVRGRFLFDLIKPFINSDDVILDVACGYAPMAKQCLGLGCRYTGFDIHSEPVNYAKSQYPGGTWLHIAYEDLTMKEFSVLFLMGVDYEPYCKAGFQKWLSRLIAVGRPRLILMEMIKPLSERSKRVKLLIENLIKRQGYMGLRAGGYDARIRRASFRVYTLFTIEEK